MPNWADRLIHEYTIGKRQLRKMKNSLDIKDPIDRQDRKTISGMTKDMDFAIEWMETGRQPGTLRGIDKRSIYQRKSLESMDIIPDITEQLDINKKRLYLSEEQKSILLNVFTSFSLRERQCYILHTAQGMSMQDIADELGIKKRTVQQYIERARKKVEQRVS